MALSSEKTSDTAALAVIGAGYVGLVTGACFSYFGHNVGIIEIESTKVKSLNEGILPIYEPGLAEIIAESRSNDRLHYFHGYKEFFAQKRPEIVFIAVGTPEMPDGSCNLDYVMGATRAIAEYANNDLVIVLKSTVPVGTARKVKALLAEIKPKFKISVVNNPEFLKEGEAVADFMRPERVVIGGVDEWAVNKVKSLYETLLHNDHPLFVTDHETAELSKLSANLALASRVSLINQISRLASATGANIRQVERILRSDSRIGSRYLFAGLGYGGSCFPKDVKSFINLCKTAGIDSSFAERIHSFNEEQKLFFMKDLEQNFPDAKSTTIALLGVGFKPNTDDIREGAALKLTEELVRRGYRLQAYDPKALENYRRWCHEHNIQGVTFSESTEQALAGAQVALITTEWQEFQRLGFGPLKSIFQGRKVYDGKNIFNPARIKEMGFEYMGVGQS